MNHVDSRDLFAYVFSADVPNAFARHLLRHSDRWDAVFRRRIDELAYEFRPDLAVWELTVARDGSLGERRLPFRLRPPG